MLLSSIVCVLQPNAAWTAASTVAAKKDVVTVTTGGQETGATCGRATRAASSMVSVTTEPVSAFKDGWGGTQSKHYTLENFKTKVKIELYTFTIPSHNYSLI